MTTLSLQSRLSSLHSFHTHMRWLLPLHVGTSYTSYITVYDNPHIHATHTPTPPTNTRYSYPQIQPPTTYHCHCNSPCSTYCTVRSNLFQHIWFTTPPKFYNTPPPTMLSSSYCLIVVEVLITYPIAWVSHLSPLQSYLFSL